ncbi:MAG: hypothetical protein Q8M92_03590 [Candidatus Subteraquimicrobiales bacterium]|nr:hypothetical protein [Candidatus Subteraquimicrobiales bacterium]
MKDEIAAYGAALIDSLVDSRWDRIKRVEEQYKLYSRLKSKRGVYIYLEREFARLGLGSYDYFQRYMREIEKHVVAGKTVVDAIIECEGSNKWKIR